MASMRNSLSFFSRCFLRRSVLFLPVSLSSLRSMVLGFAFDHHSRSIIVQGGKFCVLKGRILGEPVTGDSPAESRVRAG